MAHGVHSFPQASAHPLHALSGPRLLGLLVALGTPHCLWDQPVVVHRAPCAGVGNAHGGICSRFWEDIPGKQCSDLELG